MSRKLGDEFEKELAQKLNLKTTANSGAIFDDADLRPTNGKPVLIEAKVKNTLGAPFTHAVRKEVIKLKLQAEERFIHWLYIIRCKEGDFAILDVDTLEHLTREYLKDGEKG
jgi:hypothetical protein